MATSSSKRINPLAVESRFVSISFDAGVLTIRPAGPRLGEAEAFIIAAEVKLALDAAGNRLRGIALDLINVQMMSSFGLGLCIKIRNSGKSARVPTMVVGMSQELGDLFKIMNVDRLYAFANTPDEAARAMAA